MKSVWERASVVACAVVWASSSYALEGWGEDLAQGLATAKAEGRCVLVEFTGSDWCPPCMYVRRKVLPSPEFKSFAERNRLVLVELDFPRDKGKVAPEVRELREQISQRYGVDAYPTIMLLDAQGYPYARMEGAPASAVEYVHEIQAGMKLKESFEKGLAAANELHGQERVEALQELLKLLPEDIRPLRSDIVDAIIENDPEDVSGFKKARERQKLMDTQLSAWRLALFRELMKQDEEREDDAIEWDYIVAMRDFALKELERAELLPETQQIIYSFVGEAFALDNHFEQALTYICKAIELAPNTKAAEQLRKLRLRLQEALQK